MRIRPTEADDFVEIAALTNVFIRESATHFGYEEETVEGLRAVWEAARGTYPWLTVEVEGRFAAYAKSSVWRGRSAYRHTAETTIYVCEFARRRGVGRALYEAMLEELRGRGFHTAIAGITLPNEASVRLHESLGFAYVATFREVGWKFERWHDVGFWQVMLGEGAFGG